MLYRKSLIAILIKVLSAVLVILFNLYIVKSIGTTESGSFYWVLSMSLVFASVFNIGLNNASLKLVSSSFLLGEYGKAKGYIITIFKLAFFASLLFIIPSLILFLYFEKTQILNIILLSFLLSSIAINSHIIQGLNYVSLSMLFANPFTLLGCLSISFLMAPNNSQEMVLYFLTSSTIVWLCSLMFIFSKIRYFNVEKIDNRSVLEVAKPMFFIGVISQLNEHVGILMLGLLSNTEQVTYFTVTNRVAMVMSFMLIAVNKVIAPQISALFKKNEMIELEALVMKTSRLFSMIAILSFFSLYFLDEVILRYFGDEFVESDVIIMLWILVFGQSINLITGSVGTILQMTGNADLVKNNMIIAFSISSLLGVILIPLYGGLGAAIMTAFSMSLTNVLSLLSVKRKLNINTLKMW